HPAKGVGFIAEVIAGGSADTAGVKAGVNFFAGFGSLPVITAIFGGDAIARMLAGLECIGINEIACPVFFGGKISIPGRQTTAAVVKRTAGFGAGRAVAGNHFG